VAWSCRMNVTWIMHTGLSEILYHNEQTSPLLWAYMYMYVYMLMFIYWMLFAPI